MQTLLKKAAGLEIAVICPLHGPIWRENLSYILEKYQKWSTYEAEDQAVVIMYASMYGNTASAADISGATSIYPSKYDLREKGRATTVKNQGSLGTCWASASVSALETAL